MAFVHGHPRDLGWVKAHRRRPNRAEGGQLPLIVDPAAVDPAAVDPAAVDPAAVDPAADPEEREPTGPAAPERAGEPVSR